MKKQVNSWCHNGIMKKNWKSNNISKIKLNQSRNRKLKKEVIPLV